MIRFLFLIWLAVPAFACQPENDLSSFQGSFWIKTEKSGPVLGEASFEVRKSLWTTPSGQTQNYWTLWTRTSENTDWKPLPHQLISDKGTCTFETLSLVKIDSVEYQTRNRFYSDKDGLWVELQASQFLTFSNPKDYLLAQKKWESVPKEVLPYKLFDPNSASIFLRWWPHPLSQYRYFHKALLGK